jgi:hypothetical protein
MLVVTSEATYEVSRKKGTNDLDFNEPIAKNASEGLFFNARSMSKPKHPSQSRTSCPERYTKMDVSQFKSCV